MTTVTISETASAVKALYGEMEIVNNMQLTVAEEQSRLIAQQIYLAQKSVALADALGKLVKGKHCEG